jgi:hypothetical protein
VGREARPVLKTGPAAGVMDVNGLDARSTRYECDDTSTFARRGTAQGGASLGHVKVTMWETMPPTDSD